MPSVFIWLPQKKNGRTGRFRCASSAAEGRQYFRRKRHQRLRRSRRHRLRGIVPGIPNIHDPRFDHSSDYIPQPVLSAWIPFLSEREGTDCGAGKGKRIYMLKYRKGNCRLPHFYRFFCRFRQARRKKMAKLFSFCEIVTKIRLRQ